MDQEIVKTPNLTENLPKEVKKIFKAFLKEGDEIRLVGGCVRDLLLEKQVNDFDFATKFLPEEIIETLTENSIKAVPTGEKFGTITAVINKQNFEITTLRKDTQSDGRHCVPEYVDNYYFDAARRDFTINALYLDQKGEIYDYFDGIPDLETQQVRFIGNACERIQEDFLRILRFFRFSCDYAKNPDLESFKACIRQKSNLKTLSRERIRIEFLKLLSSQRKVNLVDILQAFVRQTISSELFTEKLNIDSIRNLFEAESKLNFKASLNLKIAALFFSKDIDLKTFFTEICATNLEKRYFQFFSRRFSENNSELNLLDLKHLLAFEKKDLVLDFYVINLLHNFHEIDVMDAKNNLEFIKNFALPDFPINGEDIKELGYKGEEIGNKIEEIKKFWAQNDFSLSKSDLLKFLQ